jgi:glycine cleavage system H protein
LKSVPPLGAAMELEGCPLPDDLLYDAEEATWVRIGPNDGLWELGLTAAQIAFAGRILSLTFRPIDAPLERGRSVATIESARLTGPVRLPAAATVIARNEELRTRPRLLNDAPYGAGWIVRLRPRDATPPAHLETAAAIADRVRRRIAELRIRCWPALPDVEMIEVGTECSATLSRLDEEIARRTAGEVVLLVTDDPTSPIELVRWADRSGHRLLAHRREGALEQFLLRKEALPLPRVRRSSTGQI